jgi:hypothetical protein
MAVGHRRNLKNELALNLGTSLMNHNILLLLPLLLSAQFPSADEPIRERIEWADIWVTDANKDDLPRVLLVGDSITRGYFGEVEKHLAGKAYCARLTTSKCVSDPSFADEVQLVLKHYKFSVAHFNNGLHGWGYTEPQYRDGLVETVDAIHLGESCVSDVRLDLFDVPPPRLPSGVEDVDDNSFHEPTDAISDTTCVFQ